MLKIVFAGAGGGGHFFPIIAVAQKVNRLIEQEKLIDVKLYYIGDAGFDERLLFQNKITFIKIETGKLRRYFSLENITDIFKTIGAMFRAFGKLYSLYPDVVVAKGGYGSFPVLFAARLLRIPVIIHESDTVPGKVNQWAGDFAHSIAISYPSTAKFFPKDRVAYTGQPVREEVLAPMPEGARQLLGLEEGVPVVLIMGGSQGAQLINEAVISVVAQLVEKVQIIHQTGSANIEEISRIGEALLDGSQHKSRYHPFPFLNDEAQRMSAGVASLVISRAGSSIFEIAAWGLPSIIIPITKSNGDHQRQNAFTYARSGACEVIEEANLTPHLLASEIERIIDDEEIRRSMSEKAFAFAKLDAAEKIARQAVNILLDHKRREG